MAHNYAPTAENEFLIGDHVEMQLNYSDSEPGTVVGYTADGLLKVCADDDGTILTGPEWMAYLIS